MAVKSCIEPFRLRDHLVPFLFSEFKSEETVLMPHLEAKAVKLNKRSSFSRIIGLVHGKYEDEAERFDYKIQFTKEYRNGVAKYTSALYKVHKNIYEQLSFAATDNAFINGFFEDVFRTAFVYYVDGSKENTEKEIIRAINGFIDKYELLEFGFDTETLRILYYREVSKETRLSRFQHKVANRVINY